MLRAAAIARGPKPGFFWTAYCIRAAVISLLRSNRRRLPARHGQ
jgi:hypothetical protein